MNLAIHASNTFEKMLCLDDSWNRLEMIKYDVDTASNSASD